MEYDDLAELLSDDDSGKEVKPITIQKNEQKKSLIMNAGPINIDLMPSSESNENDIKIDIPPKKVKKENSIKIQESKPNPPTQNKNLANFVFSDPIPNNPVIPIPQIKQSFPSSGSNNSLEKISKINNPKNIASIQSSSIIQTLPQQINKKINDTISIFDERKEIENKINELNNQTEDIKSKYSRSIGDKIIEYNKLEKNNNEEIEKLENKYENKLNKQENYFKEKEEKFIRQKNRIEEDKRNRINNIREMQEKIFQQEIESLDNNFKFDKEKIESTNKLELEEINMKLENIKEEKKKLAQDEIENKKIEEIYNDLYDKINSNNYDIDLNIELKQKEFLKKELDSRCEELTNEMKKIKEEVQLYNKKIEETKLELEEITNKIENEKKKFKR